MTLPTTFCDGGHPVAFGLLPSGELPTKQSTSRPVERSRNGMLYFHTFYDDNQTDALYVSAESIERLFRKGVDRTIACLTSESLSSPPKADKMPSDKMVLIMPGSEPVAE